MPDQDQFYTIQKAAVAEHKEKGSRFLAHAYPVQTTEEAKEKWQALKKEHPKAAHHCFAYRLGLDGNQFRANDDGEPSGTAGKPILGQIDSRGVTDTLVVVVRYFGGVLLGVPGLINAYKTSASLVLQLTPVIQKPVLENYRLTFDYTSINDIMVLLKQYQCVLIKQELSMFSSLEAGIPKAHVPVVLQRLTDLRNIEVVKI